MTTRRSSQRKLDDDVLQMNYILRRWMTEPWKQDGGCGTWNIRKPYFDDLVADLKDTTGIDYPVKYSDSESKNNVRELLRSEQYKRIKKEIRSGRRQGMALHVLRRWHPDSFADRKADVEKPALNPPVHEGASERAWWSESHAMSEGNFRQEPSFPLTYEKTRGGI